jgi:hypothetical protein
MAESTLTAAFTDLQSSVGFFLGYGRNSENWTSRQSDNIAAVLKAGLRQFYYCAYDWSFLKPWADIPLHQGENIAALPDDYGAMDGPVTVSVLGQSSFYSPLSLGDAHAVYEREKRLPDTQGIPLVICEEVIRGTDAVNGQRMRLRVWPSADSDYILTFPYRILPDALSGAMPYAYGGGQHAETLLQSCKAAAERDIDSVGAGDPKAVHQPEFARMLEQSKAMDRRTKAQTVGPMLDHSDLRRRRFPGQALRPLLPIEVQGTIWN